MSALSTYQVLDRQAPRKAADPKVRRIAEAIRQASAAEVPHDTGTYGGNWTVTPGRVPAVYIVSNDTPYARYVEYGTRHMPARPVFGRIIARVRAQVSR